MLFQVILSRVLHLVGLPLQTSNYRVIGQGIYTLSDAQRLTGIPGRRIRRWTRGYNFVEKGKKHFSPPVIAETMRDLTNEPVLSFLDLIEIRFLNAFREHGVSWKAIRIAAKKAQELLSKSHPFSTKIFKTDGRTILAKFVEQTGDQVLLDLIKNQYEFEKVVSPFLYGGLEFNESDEPLRWYPLEESTSVVIDPARGFGAPIISKGGIPTKILFKSFGSIQSFRKVADWYEVDENSVRDAIRYEKNLTH
ncbi:MAG TPA: DUF433 domain-containing protein [Bacteroidota bacterium]|nr:DUF433 domain-containing protein [Bacteroidota bacterium]